MIQNKENMNRIRVLMLADDCNPDWQSLPAIAYNLARTIADYIDVVVVTQIRNKPNIDRMGIGNAKVVYLDTEKIAAPIFKLASFLSGSANTGMTIKVALSYPSYLVFEWAVWKRFRQDLHNGHFDIVHRLSPMSPTLPSPMAKWSPVPFAIGPINGGLPWPPQFKTELNREREWLTYFRKAHKWLPFYRSTYTHAATILAAYEHTISDLPASVKPKIIDFREGGMEPKVFNMPTRPKRERMTILFVGRLVPYKMPEVVVRSFAASSLLRQHKLVIVGDGPERPRLDRIIEEEGLSDCIEFTGTIPQVKVGELMRQADIFAFPSIRELGGGVITLAMACGMACVVVDYGAMGELVKPGCGVKVALGDLEHLVKQYTIELEELVTNPDRVARMGIAAHQITTTYYSWDAKAKQIMKIYNWVLGRQEAKPDFHSGDKLSNFLPEPV